MQVPLPREAHILTSACNPCMDLLALVSHDEAPAPAASGPPGLTPAQIAMRQRMLAMQARRMGVANPMAPGAGRDASSLRRGSSLRMVVWRMSDTPSRVWDVVLEPVPTASSDERRSGWESMSVLSLVWSPDGT